MKNKYTLIIGGLIILLSIIYVLSITVLKKPQTEKDSVSLYPSPTTISNLAITFTPSSVETMQKERELYSENQKKQDEKDKAFFEREQKVGRLLFVVPYTGVNFSVTHDYSIAKFIVIIPKTKEREGNQEFDEFIKKNGVEDRSWIRSNLLEIRYN